jgi:hypothetical protein
MNADAIKASVWGLHVMLIDKSFLLIAAPRDDFHRLAEWRRITQDEIIKQGPFSRAVQGTQSI